MKVVDKIKIHYPQHKDRTQPENVGDMYCMRIDRSHPHNSKYMIKGKNGDDAYVTCTEETALLFAKALKYGVREKCENCKYWKEDTHYKSGECDNPARTEGCHHGYNEDLFISKDFGCIHHEKKGE